MSYKESPGPEAIASTGLLTEASTTGVVVVGCFGFAKSCIGIASLSRIELDRSVLDLFASLGDESLSPVDIFFKSHNIKMW